MTHQRRHATANSVHQIRIRIRRGLAGGLGGLLALLLPTVRTDGRRKIGVEARGSGTALAGPLLLLLGPLEGLIGRNLGARARTRTRRWRR